jgi:hypothetical protein
MNLKYCAGAAALILTAGLLNVVAHAQSKTTPAKTPAKTTTTKAASSKAAPAKPHLSVYKTPTCGCCAKWVEYMEANGFTASTTNMPDVTPIKVSNGLPPRLSSCHTTLVGGYVIEGHVPVSDIRRLLKEKPAIAGLAAPGMPAGSPGMDVPNSPAYDIIAFDKTGKTSVYSTQKPK